MKSKILKSIIASLLSVAMLMSFAACGGSDSEEDKKNGSAGASASDNADVNSDEKSTIDKNAQVGDYITFGSYEQDGNTSNGKESIEWLVLDVQDGKALVISKYALDCKPYNEGSADITWENCTLRTWLNNVFYDMAFSTNEKNKIATTTVAAEDNSDYGTEAGNNTQDKVFALSISEAKKYFSSVDELCCKPTQYATNNGAYVYDNPGSDYYGSCWWWIRSPGDSQNDATVVDIDGISVYGYTVDSSDIAVRPAMWITLD